MPSDVGHGLAVHAPMSRDFGDPIAMLIGPGATELDIAHLRRLFGLRAGRRHRPPVRLLPAGPRRQGRGRNGVTGVRADSVTLNVALRWNGTEVRCRAGETVAVALLCAGRLDVRRSPQTGSLRVTQQLINDMKTEATLEGFEECQTMIRFRDTMEEKFHEVLSAIDSSWLSFPRLQAFLTGGGASLDMVTRLAAERPVVVGEKTATPVRVTQPPPRAPQA